MLSGGTHWNVSRGDILVYPLDTAPRPIIITAIKSGLGNQLFQYATARRLAVASGGHLVLLLLRDYLTEPHSRRFGLQNFNVAGHTVLQSRAAATIGKLFPNHPMPTHESREKPIFEGVGQNMNDPFFIRDVLTWREGLELDGYWQDERYFADIRPRIIRDFTLKEPLDSRSRDCLARIRAAPSAFFHIRRGDYLSAEFCNLFGVCTADYYGRALEILRARVPRVRVFVFSDDPGWVRENAIGGEGAEIVDWNAAAPAHDLALMRACSHAVIANSSFGWWGAWLGELPGGIIIAPRLWYKAVPEYRDIVPDRWMRI